MPTVLTQDGFRVRVLGPPREHPPPHVHVEHGPDGLVIIRLGTPASPPEIWAVYQMKARDVVRAYRLVEQHQDIILAAGEGFMAKSTVADAAILAQIPAARLRARRSLKTQPHASEVRYERAGRRLHVTLTNGAVIVVPVTLIPTLRAAADRDLALATVGPAGVGLRWERLDEDLSIAGLLRLAVGSRTLLSASGAAGGASRTTAKARAARLNGARGGRPRGRD